MVDAAFLSVDKQYLTGLQSAFLLYLASLKAQYAGLGGHHDMVLFCYQVTGGAQSVAVQHTAGITSVTEEQRRRTVPRLHQNGVVFVECL